MDLSALMVSVYLWSNFGLATGLFDTVTRIMSRISSLLDALSILPATFTTRRADIPLYEYCHQ
jgi:hypothetical protein